MEKQCCTCKKNKPIDSYYKDNKYTDGFKNECKKCVSARALNNWKKRESKIDNIIGWNPFPWIEGYLRKPTKEEINKFAKENTLKDTKTALIIPDCHIPFHDKKAYSLMLQVAKDINPDEIVILGDYGDFYSVSGHDKTLSVDDNLNKEIKDVVVELKVISSLFPNAKKVFIEGNHENRLVRYITKNAPELYGTITLNSLLHLDELGYELIPYTHDQRYSVLGSKLFARHKPFGGGKYATHATVSKAMCSVICGHQHTIQEHQECGLDGTLHRGIMCGWLGDQNADVMKYLKRPAPWSLGFSIVTTISDRSWFNNTIHIINNKCSYNGKIYS